MQWIGCTAVHASDVTHCTFVWHDSTWLIPIFVWHDSIIHLCEMTHPYMCVPRLIRTYVHSHATHISELHHAYHTYKSFTSHIWKSHLWMNHVWMSHATRINASCHTYESVMSHLPNIYKNSGPQIVPVCVCVHVCVFLSLSLIFRWWHRHKRQKRPWNPTNKTHKHDKQRPIYKTKKAPHLGSNTVQKKNSHKWDPYANH